MFAVIILPQTSVTGRGDRKPSAMDDQIYEIILRLELGKFKKPVNERTTQEKSAIVRRHRYKGRWSVELIQGRHVLMLGEFEL